MPGNVLFEKVIATLPIDLTANTFYAVRVGEGFDLYLSDVTGTIAHKINGGIIAPPPGATPITKSGNPVTITAGGSPIIITRSL